MKADYLDQIRTSAQQGADLRGSADHPIGGVAHWKAECAKQKAKQNALHNKIKALEQEIKEKSRLLSASALSVSSRRKRGRDNTEATFDTIEATKKQVRMDRVEKLIQRKEKSVQQVVDTLDQHGPTEEGMYIQTPDGLSNDMHRKEMPSSTVPLTGTPRI